MTATQSSPAEPDARPEGAAAVEVAVKRTGGFAGLTKQWHAEPAADEAPQWIALIAQCPWDAAAPVPTTGDTVDTVDDAAPHPAPSPGPSPTPSAAGPPPQSRNAGADRFTWWIRARCGEDLDRETELGDDEVVGAWRELVDAVRDWSRS